jgi:hypothetical protein
MVDDPPRLTRVFQLIDGTVVALDQYNRWMPEFEGPAGVAVPKILAAGWRGPFIVAKDRQSLPKSNAPRS